MAASVLFRGAGDLVSGSIRRAHLAHLRVACTELAEPLCVRRLVSYSEAVYEGRITVEGVTAVRVEPDGLDGAWSRGEVPVVVDPGLSILDQRPFDVLVDGTMAKRNLGTRIDHASRVIALGPGFAAGRDCHAVVETLAGHDLGRVIYEGSAAADTGVPGPPEAYLGPPSACCSGASPWDAILLRAPCDGTFRGRAAIGDLVEEGRVLGDVDGEPIRAGVRGVVRGLIRDGRAVTRGLKIGDVDPTCEPRRATTISEKSNAIAGGVLEAILTLSREASTGR
ncbi:MAG: EF2563 family selenium-dependent molybdenum hydroxylase system protein [Deltaproteobacteria bacterium]|nr:EF2563 family selenium-dependent molybdenum hydroxylase system protein [Deltaproteobacteria bacterium]